MWLFNCLKDVSVWMSYCLLQLNDKDNMELFVFGAIAQKQEDLCLSGLSYVLNETPLCFCKFTSQAATKGLVTDIDWHL